MIGRVKIIDLEWAGEDHLDCLFGNAKECQWIILGEPTPQDGQYLIIRDFFQSSRAGYSTLLTPSTHGISHSSLGHIPSSRVKFLQFFSGHDVDNKKK